MMDIRYMIADPCSAPPGAAQLQAEGPVVEDRQRVFDELFAELKAAVVRRRQETLPSQVKALTALSVSLPDIDAGKTMDKIYAGDRSPDGPGVQGRRRRRRTVEGLRKAGLGADGPAQAASRLRLPLFRRRSAPDRHPGYGDQGPPFSPRRGPPGRQKRPVLRHQALPAAGVSPGGCRTAMPGTLRVVPGERHPADRPLQHLRLSANPGVEIR